MLKIPESLTNQTKLETNLYWQTFDYRADWWWHVKDSLVAMFCLFPRASFGQVHHWNVNKVRNGRKPRGGIFPGVHSEDFWKKTTLSDHFIDPDDDWLSACKDWSCFSMKNVRFSLLVSNQTVLLCTMRRLTRLNLLLADMFDLTLL